MTESSDPSQIAWREQFLLDGVSLGFFRILFAFFVLLTRPLSYSWLGDIPDAFFDPPLLSLASLFHSFPSKGFFVLVDIAIFVSVFTLAIGCLTRTSTLVLLMATIVGDSFRFSFGKIDHGIMLQCVLLVMIFADWGRAFSVDSCFPRRREKTPRRVSLQPLAILVAFYFFSGGFGKALSWIDFDFSQNGFLSWLYGSYYNHERQMILAPLAIKLRPLWLWEFADIAAVIFELGFVVAMFRRRSMYLWLMLAALFHLFNGLVLNILFIVTSIAYLAFVPWSQLFPGLKRLAEKPMPWLGGVAIITLSLLGIRMFWSSCLAAVTYPLPLDPGQSLLLVLLTICWLVVAVLFALTIRCKTGNTLEKTVTPE
jgi:hypothetical protein